MCGCVRSVPWRHLSTSSTACSLRAKMDSFVPKAALKPDFDRSARTVFPTNHALGAWHSLSLLSRSDDDPHSRHSFQLPEHTEKANANKECVTL